MEERYHIRLLKPSEADFLKEMYYEALFVPPGQPPFPRDILEKPEMKKGYSHWGVTGDVAFVAEDKEGKLAGAAWVRLFTKDAPGYGFVSESIPELCIALRPDCRGKGLGKRLMTQLIETIREKGYEGISLSVDTRNPAYHLYLKLGFIVVKSEGNPTMLLQF